MRGDRRAERGVAAADERIETTLERQPYLTGPSPTIADLALYAYTERAPEGGVSLDPYPKLRGWHARIEGLSGFVPMRRAS